MSGFWPKLYLLAGPLILVSYLYTETRGVVFGGADARQALPAEAKSKGYRSPGFWFVGYQGGK